MAIVTLTAMKADSPLRARGELNFYVQAPAFGLAETCHAAILHHWMDLVEGKNVTRADG
jgi:D-sedoheptulose 7-phosphate isomerase